MPRAVFLTTLSLAALAGLVGFWLGQQRAGDDISGLINAVAQSHMDRYGGDRSSCLGWVIEGDDTLRVTCGPHEYRVDRRGRVTEVLVPET